MMWVSLRGAVMALACLLALGGVHASPGVVEGGPSPPVEGTIVEPGHAMAAPCPTDAGNGTASNGTLPDLQNATGILCEATAGDHGNDTLAGAADETHALPDQGEPVLRQVQVLTPISLTNPGPPRPVYKGSVDPPLVGDDGEEETSKGGGTPEVPRNDAPEHVESARDDRAQAGASAARPAPPQQSPPDEADAPPDDPRALSLDPAEIGAGNLQLLAPLAPLAFLSMVLLWRVGSRLGRFFPLPLAALYARMHGGQLEENPHRRLILDFIQENPGASLQKVSHGTEISYSTVKYHIKVLEYHDQLVSRRIGKRRCFFSNGAEGARNLETRVMLDNHPLSRGLVSYVGARPGVIQKDICRTFGIWPSHAHALLGRLEDLGVIETKREGRAVHYFPAASFHHEHAASWLDPVSAA